MPNPTCTACGQRVVEWSSDEHHPSAEGDCLQNVGASSKAAVDHDGRVAHRFDHVSKNFHWRNSAVQLTPAVIGKDDTVCAAGLCDEGILDAQDAFDHQVTFPLTPDLLHMRPVQLAASSLGVKNAWRNDRLTTLCQHVLEVRHAVHHQGPKKRADSPAGLDDAIPRKSQARLQWRGESCSDVVLAICNHRAVNRQHQRAKARGRNTIDQRRDLGEIAW